MNAWQNVPKLVSWYEMKCFKYNVLSFLFSPLHWFVDLLCIYPSKQSHRKPPNEFTHLWSQPPLLFSHSLISGVKEKYSSKHPHCIKMKFLIKDFFSKCDQIGRKPRIWSHFLKKSLMVVQSFFVQCRYS